MDVSSLENEVFPMEEDLVNFTQQLSPAQISIPAQVLLEETSRSGRDGKLWVLIVYAYVWSHFLGYLSWIQKEVYYMLIHLSAVSIPIAHVLFHNLDEFLPSVTSGLKLVCLKSSSLIENWLIVIHLFFSNSRVASAVLSSQVGNRQTSGVFQDTLELNPISLTFRFNSVCYY